MRKDRREFLGAVATGVAAVTAVSAKRHGRKAETKIKAVAFDAFPIFDPRPISALAEQLFPGRGDDLNNLWRERQFAYTWLRTASRQYADFWKVTEDALTFAARMLRLNLGSAQRRRLMSAYLDLKPWPDVAPILRSLKAAGLRLALLSNFTGQMLASAIRSAKLEDVFEHAISTDLAKTYKPAPRAYHLGVEALGLRREEIVFAAFAGWDAAGAKWFGYPTFWVNRLGLPAEEFGVEPDAVGVDLNDLLRFVKA